MNKKAKTDIENGIFEEILLTLEGEYTMDRLNNLIYKEGGRKRAMERIKSILRECEEKHNIPQQKIKNRIKHTMGSMENSTIREFEELFFILEDIEIEGKVEKNIEQGNTEKYERNI